MLLNWLVVSFVAAVGGLTIWRLYAVHTALKHLDAVIETQSASRASDEQRATSRFEKVVAAIEALFRATTDLQRSVVNEIGDLTAAAINAVTDLDKRRDERLHQHIQENCTTLENAIRSTAVSAEARLDASSEYMKATLGKLVTDLEGAAESAVQRDSALSEQLMLVLRTLARFAEGTSEKPQDEKALLGEGRSITDESGNPLIHICPVGPVSDRCPGAPIGPQLRSRLASLIQQVQLLSFSGRTLGDRRRYIVKFTREVMQGLQNGKFDLMRGAAGAKAVAKDVKSGKVVEIGAIQKGGSLGPAVISLGWSIAAMVTAQHFLTEINKKLSNIEGILNSVSERQSREPVEDLLGIIRYLSDRARAISMGELCLVELAGLFAELEASHRRACVLSERFRNYAHESARSFCELKISGIFGVDDAASTGIRHLSEYEMHSTLHLRAAAIKLLLAGLRCKLKSDGSATAILLDSLERDLAVVEQAHGTEYDQMRAAIARIHTTFTPKDEHARRAIRSEVFGVRDRLRAEITDLRTQTSWVREQLVSDGEHQIELEVNPDGTITEMYLLPEPAATSASRPPDVPDEYRTTYVGRLDE